MEQNTKESNVLMIARILSGVLALVNLILQIYDMPHLEIGSEDLTLIANLIWVVGSTAWGYWKNNNFTPEAKEGQAVTNKLKAERKVAKAETQTRTQTQPNTSTELGIPTLLSKEQ